jgi:hypothetical protein
MISNIIDRRKRHYRWKQITAIVESTYHDNTVDDSDQIESEPDPIVYDARPVTSVAEAIAWATALPCSVTLFLYDQGSGI